MTPDETLRKLGPLLTEGLAYEVLMEHLEALLKRNQTLLEKAVGIEDIYRYQGVIRNLRTLLQIREDFRASSRTVVKGEKIGR